LPITENWSRQNKGKHGFRSILREKRKAKELPPCPRSAQDPVRRAGSYLGFNLFSNKGQIGNRTGFGPFDGLLRRFAGNRKAAHGRKLLNLGGVKFKTLRFALCHFFHYKPFL